MLSLSDIEIASSKCRTRNLSGIGITYPKYSALLVKVIFE